MPLLGGVMSDSSLHQVPYEGGRQGIVRLKPNSAPAAGVVTLEFVLVGPHDAEEGAVVRGGRETTRAIFR